MVCPYSILGLDPHVASREDVRRAYQQLVIKHHPDKPTGCPVMFQKIHSAFNKLWKQEEYTHIELSPQQICQGGFIKCAICRRPCKKCRTSKSTCLACNNDNPNCRACGGKTLQCIACDGAGFIREEREINANVEAGQQSVNGMAIAHALYDTYSWELENDVMVATLEVSIEDYLCGVRMTIHSPVGEYTFARNGAYDLDSPIVVSSHKLIIYTSIAPWDATVSAHLNKFASVFQKMFRTS